MSHTRTFTRALAGEGVETTSYAKEVTAGQLVDVSESVADESTDYHLAWPVNIEAAKAILIGSDQDVTIEINYPGGTSTAADQTLTMKANQPLLWLDDDADSCPITQDVTDVYVTNASGAAANIRLLAMVDPSP
jgi:hypothetical protein